MFEAAEVGRRISKEAYRRRQPGLRAALLDAQQRLREAPFPVIVDKYYARVAVLRTACERLRKAL
jgi:hypothetical protein